MTRTKMLPTCPQCKNDELWIVPILNNEVRCYCCNFRSTLQKIEQNASIHEQEKSMKLSTVAEPLHNIFSQRMALNALLRSALKDAVDYSSGETLKALSLAILSSEADLKKAEQDLENLNNIVQ